MNSRLIKVIQACVRLVSISLWQGPMDIRLDYGVWIEKLPGSRVAYDTFPGDFKITPG